MSTMESSCWGWHANGWQKKLRHPRLAWEKLLRDTHDIEEFQPSNSQSPWPGRQLAGSVLGKLNWGS